MKGEGGMKQYYLAIDIGASSGRHILAHLDQGKMITEEIYRFSNGMVEQNGHLIWDIEKLFHEILEGMKWCTKLNKIPVSVGIDTWAVDFVLLDDKGNVIGNPVAYRDNRTKSMDKEVYKVIDEEQLYEMTGIQKQLFNSIYQLMAIRKKQPEDLKKASKLLMIPDYFHYRFTGKAASEYTNATTTQLVHPKTKDWNWKLIESLGYPKSIFQPILLPGTELGELSKEIQDEIGYNCKVILPATHDTGSAVMAVPSNQEDILYISSGTWSLMGTELMEANCSHESKAYNLTNEGGYGYRFRYLKNIMGLWMIQNVQKEIGKDFTFGEISSMASKETIASIIDCNDHRFLAPKSMTTEVQATCEESGQQIPETLSEVAAVIYRSLAACYGETIKEIEGLTGKNYSCIHVIGGGSNATYLNELTAIATGKPVYAGPVEATAIGNLVAQMISRNEFKNLNEARECILHSFPVKIFNKLTNKN